MASHSFHRKGIEVLFLPYPLFPSAFNIAICDSSDAMRASSPESRASGVRLRTSGRAARLWLTASCFALGEVPVAPPASCFSEVRSPESEAPFPLQKAPVEVSCLEIFFLRSEVIFDVFILSPFKVQTLEWKIGNFFLKRFKSLVSCVKLFVEHLKFYRFDFDLSVGNTPIP